MGAAGMKKKSLVFPSAKPRNYWRRRKRIMSKKSNRINVPEARAAMDKFKMEAASDFDVSTSY